MKHTASLVAVVALPLLLLLCCCGGAYFAISALVPFGEDRWKHYSTGGMFVTDSPALSTDGDQIVFATPHSGHGDVYLADVASGAATRLTDTDAFESSPYFLPNSRQVVFERGSPPARHIWLLDLQTGQERQLTCGQVLDDIESIAPTGRHILISRSTNRGYGRVVQPHVVEVGSGTTRRVPGVIHGVFGENSPAPWATWEGAGEKLGQVTVDGQRKQPVGKGWIVDVCEEAGLAVFMHLEQVRSWPNQELHSLSLASGDQQRIGMGHSARVFANGKVLLFVGYEHKAFIWELDQEPRPIPSPPGHKLYGNRSASGNTAAMFIMTPNEPSRDYDVFLFDAEEEIFRQIPITYPERN